MLFASIVKAKHMNCVTVTVTLYYIPVVTYCVLLLVSITQSFEDWASFLLVRPIAHAFKWSCRTYDDCLHVPGKLLTSMMSNVLLCKILRSCLHTISKHTWGIVAGYMC